jgi:hypothetical protein
MQDPQTLPRAIGGGSTGIPILVFYAPPRTCPCIQHRRLTPEKSSQ